MTTSAFADSKYTACPNLPAASSSNYMNLYGNSSSVAGRYITLYNPALYEESIGQDQIINMIRATIDGHSGIYLTFRGNTQYAINRNSTNTRAFMYPYPAGARDSVLSNFSAEGTVRLLAGDYAGQYLGWESDSNFANVYFGRGGSNWLWALYTEGNKSKS